MFTFCIIGCPIFWSILGPFTDGPGSKLGVLNPQTCRGFATAFRCVLGDVDGCADVQLMSLRRLQ